tara:strand:+ start:532 stop:1077 length:546 start_codon:yes stop_codon:yes gene_type:complete
VRNYVAALKHGFALVRQNKLIRLDDLIQVQQTIESNRAGVRKLPGTVLRNQATGAVAHTRPQHHDEIPSLLNNLTAYINDTTLCDADQLVKKALIHHQFESIHPFNDGNGRTGRILNILHLVAHDLLDLHLLYLTYPRKSSYVQSVEFNFCNAYLMSASIRNNLVAPMHFMYTKNLDRPIV